MALHQAVLLLLFVRASLQESWVNQDMFSCRNAESRLNLKFFNQPSPNELITFKHPSMFPVVKGTEQFGVTYIENDHPIETGSSIKISELRTGTESPVREYVVTWKNQTESGLSEGMKVCMGNVHNNIW